MLIEGKNAVRQAIEGGSTINKIYIDQNYKTRKDEIISLASKNKIRLEFLSKAILDKRSKTAHHQGYIAETVEFEYCSVEKILNTAKEYGMDALALEGTVEELIEAIDKKEVLLPCIARIVNRSQYEHYVVIYKIIKDKLYIADPDLGKIKISTKDFSQIWLGQIATFRTNKEFRKEHNCKSNFRTYFSFIMRQPTLLFMVFFLSLIISGIGILGTFIFQYIIDNVLNQNILWNEHLKVMDTFPMICIAIIFLYVTKAIFGVFRGKLLMILSKNIDLPLMLGYYEKMLENLPDYISAALIPADVDKDNVLDFSTTSSDKDVDRLEQSEKTLLGTAGGGAVLNANMITSTAAFKAWLKAETEFAISPLIPQIEGFTNRMLKYNASNPCTVKYFEVSVYTKEDVQATLLESCQYGFSNRLAYNTFNGISEKATMAMNLLENAILGLPEKMIPLSSSYTQSGTNDEGGRPETPDDELSDSGERTRNE